MYIFFLTYFVAFTTGIGEKCLTPNGLTGECLSLESCQPLLWSFSNPKDGMVEYLKKFLCSNDTDQGVIVCCRVTTDLLIFEDEEDHWDPHSIYNIKRLVNANACGVQSRYVQDDGLIALYDFPWLVKLMSISINYDKIISGISYQSKKTLEKVECTGVLITERYVLYSAQCHFTVLGLDSNFFARIDFFTGYGSNCDTASSSYKSSCSTVDTYEVENHIFHPFYDPITKLNDIAILRLNRRVPFSEFMHPICLPLLPEISKLSLVHTSGWNRTSLKTDFSVKSTYISTVLPNRVCKLSNKLNDVLTTYDMCTVNGTSSTSEVVGYPVTSLYKNQWYILGFTSRGKEPRIHTRVQNYLQWIKEIMGDERCLTPFNETGECIQLSECPRLFAAFANPDPRDEDYLNKFVCELPDDNDNADIKDYILKVCCGTSPNFTIPTNSIDDEPKSYNISDLRFCGLQHRDDYISTDNKVSVDEFPWLAAIINGTLPSQRDGICGGTLINNRYVLTSVQCTTSFSDEDTMLVRLGDYNLKTDVDCFQLLPFNAFECADVHDFGVEKRIDHPFFNRFQLINDISLLRLNKSVTFSDYIRPICLPTSDEDLMRFGETFYTTGFGDNDRKILGPKTKKKIPTILIALDVCNEKGKQLENANLVTDYEICTEDVKNSTDVTCVGDEGGPVMFSKKFRWFIHGISSTFGCRDDEPQTHTKVFKYLKWIKLNLKM